MAEAQVQKTHKNEGERGAGDRFRARRLVSGFWQICP